MSTTFKHYIISFVAGVLVYLIAHVLPIIPASGEGAIAIMVAYYLHHWLENSDSTDIINVPSTTPALGGGSGSDTSPPGPAAKP